MIISLQRMQNERDDILQRMHKECKKISRSITPAIFSTSSPRGPVTSSVGTSCIVLFNSKIRPNSAIKIARKPQAKAQTFQSVAASPLLEFHAPKLIGPRREKFGGVD